MRSQLSIEHFKEIQARSDSADMWALLWEVRSLREIVPSAEDIDRRLTVLQNALTFLFFDVTIHPVFDQFF